MPPAQLSNTFIYLTALFKPALLRPHLRVPSEHTVKLWIGTSVTMPGNTLRYCQCRLQSFEKEGFNAVVIDKDNCLVSRLYFIQFNYLR